MQKIVIDAKGLIIGRLAAFAAKQVLTGNTVDITNVEQAVVSGNIDAIVEVYKTRRDQTQYANPEKGAKWPRRPDLLFKRIAYGMLPATRRGKQAASRLKAHFGVPAGFAKPSKVAGLKSSNDLNRSYVSLEQICAELGWKTKA